MPRPSSVAWRELPVTPGRQACTRTAPGNPAYSRSRAFPPRSTRPVHRPGSPGRCFSSRDGFTPPRLGRALSYLETPGGPGSRPTVSLGPSPPGTRDPSTGRDRRSTGSDLENSLEFGLHSSAARGSRPTESLVSSPPGTRNQPIGRDRRVAQRPTSALASPLFCVRPVPIRTATLCSHHPRGSGPRRDSRGQRPRGDRDSSRVKEQWVHRKRHLLVQATYRRLTDHRPSRIGDQVIKEPVRATHFRTGIITLPERETRLVLHRTRPRSICRRLGPQPRAPIVTCRPKKIDREARGSTAENRRDEDRRHVGTGGRDRREQTADQGSFKAEERHGHKTVIFDSA